MKLAGNLVGILQSPPPSGSAEALALPPPHGSCELLCIPQNPRRGRLRTKSSQKLPGPAQACPLVPASWSLQAALSWGGGHGSGFLTVARGRLAPQLTHFLPAVTCAQRPLTHESGGGAEPGGGVRAAGTGFQDEHQGRFPGGAECRALSLCNSHRHIWLLSEKGELGQGESSLYLTASWSSKA